MFSLILISSLLFAADINFRPVPQKEMEKVVKSIEANPPKEKTDEIKKVDLPLYPILQHGNKTYVSILKADAKLSKKWEDDLRKSYGALKNNEESYYLRDSQAQQFLKDIGLRKSQKIFYRLFENTKVETVSLSNVDRILIVVNRATGGHFGVAGVEIPGDQPPRAEALGLAWIGEQNPFSVEKAVLIKRGKNPPQLKTEKELQDYVNSKWDETDPIKFESASETRVDAVDWTLIEILYPFRSERVYQDKLTGYFLKKADTVIAIKDFYFTDDRNGHAEHIYSGALLKDFKHVFIFSSMGESDCGLILLLKNDGTWVQNRIHCGSWGC